MKHKRQNGWLAMLLGMTALLPGCSNEEDVVSQNPSKIWAASLIASKDSIAGDWDDADEQQTRAVFYGGNTARYVTLWDKNDVVHVYKDGVDAGTLSVTDSENKEAQFTLEANLSGTLTGASFAVNDDVELYLPSKARSYTGQTGTINTLSSNYSYQKKAVKVATVSGTTVKLAKANMEHRQAYFRLILKDEDGNRLHPSQITISTGSESENKLVTAVAEDGVTMTYGDLVLNAELDNGEYPGEFFISLLAGGYTEGAKNIGKATYHITCVADGVFYTNKSDLTYNFQAGALTKAVRTMLKTASTATASIPANMTVMQGTAKTRIPAVTVDGEDVTGSCTFNWQSSDYSVAAVHPETGAVVGVAPGTATITAVSKPYGATASYTVTVVSETDASVAANYVDLDLPSGTLWATRNVGAASANDAGTYFAWGEYDGYTNADDWNRQTFTEANYLAAGAATEASAADDGTTLLGRAYDAATLNLGSEWVLPTAAEWEELLATRNSSNHTWNWDATNKAWKIYSRTTKQTLILPAAGLHNGSVSGVGTTGSYWSATQGASASVAKCFTFTNSSIAPLADLDRYHGRTVRAVKAKAPFRLTVKLGQLELLDWKEWKPSVTLKPLETDDETFDAATDIAPNGGDEISLDE